MGRGRAVHLQYQTITHMKKPIIRSNVSPLALPQLFTAGRAVLTFKNTEKDTHMTIRSKQLIDRNTKERKPIFFVSVSLLGDQETGSVRCWDATRTTSSAFSLQPRCPRRR